MFNIREFWCFWTYCNFITWKDFVKLNDSSWSARECNNIVQRSFSLPPDREEMHLFFPVFARLISRPHRIHALILMVNFENSCLLSALQKCISSVERTDSISSFDVRQTGLFYFNCAVGAPVEVIYSLEGPVCSFLHLSLHFRIYCLFF